MKISIVTISFNQANYIEETIKSVLAQKNIDLEYIVVDAGSTDGSREIILKYKSQINKIIFEKDEGPADGLNKGFAHASGDIYGYINSDDIFLPSALEEVVACFTKYPYVDVLSGHGYLIDANGNKLNKIFSNKLSSTLLAKQRFTTGYSCLIQPSTFFTKDVFNKTGGFDITEKIIWDGVLALDFMNNKTNFKVVNRIWSGFRIYSSSITGSGKLSDSKALNSFQKMQIKAELTIIPGWKYPFIKYIGWLSEPSLLLTRIIEGIKNPDRMKIKLPLPKNKSEDHN